MLIMKKLERVMSDVKSINSKNMFLLKPDKDGTVKVRSKHSYFINLICRFIGHYWGTDDMGFCRVCARCGKFQQNDFKNGWVSRKKWKKLNNIKD